MIVGFFWLMILDCGSKNQSMVRLRFSQAAAVNKEIDPRGSRGIRYGSGARDNFFRASNETGAPQEELICSAV